MNSEIHIDASSPDALRTERRRPAPLATPGHLHGQVVLHVHTVHAQRLITGRAGTPERRGAVGLFTFAERAGHIWRGAQAGDPYADWWLLKLEQVLDRAEARLSDLRASTRQHLADVESFTIEVSSSTAPLPVALEFSTPVAYRAAQLVGVYDRIVREILTARQVARMTSDAASHALWLAGHEVRSTFHTAIGYVAYGITRADVAAVNATAVAAAARMGTLPDAVQADLQRAQFAPSRVHEPRRLERAESISLAERPDASIDSASVFDDDLGRLFPET